MKDAVAMINLGIDGTDDFGCDLSAKYNIPNYQYDCTNQIRPQCSKNRGNNIFEMACLSDRTETTKQWQYYSLEDMLVKHNLIHKHVVMKIDVDGAEWAGFRSFPT